MKTQDQLLLDSQKRAKQFTIELKTLLEKYNATIEPTEENGYDGSWITGQEIYLNSVIESGECTMLPITFDLPKEIDKDFNIPEFMKDI